MISPKNIKDVKDWWFQFPAQLKVITKIRFFAAFGAGGVIYLTSLIFNKIGLSATEIGFGFTLSAIIGTITRFITGNYLNKYKNIELPLKTSSTLSIFASFCLLISRDPFLYMIGQCLVGASAGIYWPTAELAVPYLCNPIRTTKAYALVRSSEALGIFLGVFIGSIFNSLIYFKSNFIIDILCMMIIILVTSRNREMISEALNNYQLTNSNKTHVDNKKWHLNTKIILISIVLMTTCLALIQVTLPLDFVKGGIFREPISKISTSFIISVQLILLFILQWPIGSWLSTKGKFFGIKFSLVNFGIGTFLLFISSYLKTFGFYIILFGIIFCSIGTSSFLPTSTDIVFSITPIHKKGFGLALLSQCFAIGYFIGPLISGRVLDYYGYATNIWICISMACLTLIILLFNKKY